MRLTQIVPDSTKFVTARTTKVTIRPMWCVCVRMYFTHRLSTVEAPVSWVHLTAKFRGWGHKCISYVAFLVDLRLHSQEWEL